MEGVGQVKLNPEFYRGKRVFLTGHTGFKGLWLAKILTMFGAEVTGYALPPAAQDGERVFRLCGLKEKLNSVTGDVRDFASLKRVFDETRPEIVLHLAAQPLVIDGYHDPAYTYAVNVMGTVHILECVRQTDSVKSFLNVTTDKVYENREWVWGYREEDKLDGFDPYSNSKSCSELVTHSYKKSFFADGKCAVSTARAGNVIGGGDFAANRIVPDCISAALKGQVIEVRHPESIRPYQHVLEPLYAYLLITQAQYEDVDCADWYNVGPEEADCVTTGELVELFCQMWGEGQTWKNAMVTGPHEARFLKLDCSKLKTVLGWKPRWTIKTAIAKTVDWAKAWRNGEDMEKLMTGQIEDFLSVR